MFRLPRKGTEYTEISLADVVYFLRSNFKFFALLALVLSVIAVALVLLMPKQYQKQVNLSVRQVTPGELVFELRQAPGRVEVDKMPLDTLNNAAVNYIQQENGNLGNVSVSPKYDAAEQQVQVALSSRDPESLDGVSSEIVDQLKAEFGKFFERSLGPAVEAKLTELKRSNDLRQELLAQIEQARPEGFEMQRAEVLNDTALAELEIRDLEQAQSELPRLASEMVSIEVVGESEAQQSSSRGRRIALAVLAALVGAAILTIVRGALWKKPRA